MTYRFRKHYTREEARSLLPQVRQWIEQLQQLRQKLQRQDQQLGQLLSTGIDAGGPLVNEWVKSVSQTKSVLQEFQERDLQVKDLDRGLIDFPAIISGREVFLCWEQDDEDIEFWHELDTGYAGRERL